MCIENDPEVMKDQDKWKKIVASAKAYQCYQVNLIRWRCQNCNKSYKNKAHLKRHFEFECNVEPKYQCTKCGVRFKHKHSLQRHLERKSLCNDDQEGKHKTPVKKALRSNKAISIPNEDFHLFLAAFLKCYMLTNTQTEPSSSGVLKNDIFPLTTIDETYKFENNLNNEEYKKKSITLMKRYIGTGQKWKQASYRLSSFMFTKELLTLFSWTGKSKTSDSKESFGRLVNILDVFFTVVSLSDPTFSHVQKEEFFKDGILKHSKTRLNAARKKGARDSNEMSQDNIFMMTTSDPQFIDIEERVEGEADVPFEIKTEDYNI
ncbi:uncharacterized protein LOC126739794 [Anthonomus grandis grandis]|uniref:uncharacterized protein LOC126739794 n=1 Tax=Anthonomus grandis grandis TaxID=2921223 RepID=UPI002165B426|nr:uncharacterized protein LOC126739794 [Anthonomus grandis grandis]